MKERKFDYDIKNKVGVLGSSGKWEKQVNIVSWNGNDVKLDIRALNNKENGEFEIGKGISLNKAEILALKEVLINLDINI